MCELFGISTKNTYPANELLRSFFSHSDEHHSGWGIAVFHNEHASIEKEPVKALDSKYLKERLRCLDQTGDMLAHIRLATVGYSVYENCHPFTGYDASGRQWTLIHNGTLFGASFLSQYSSSQIGTTDSEQLLLHILDLTDQEIKAKGRPLSFEERFELLDQITCRIADASKLNFLLHAGTDHGHTFTFTEEQLQYLYTAFSTL